MEYVNQVKYWIEASKDDLNSAESIFKNKNYDWSLFIGHLALEKILKAYFVSTQNSIPPKSHKLDYLAELCGFNLNDDEIAFLKLVNEFNLGARYPDYKRKFKEICT